MGKRIISQRRGRGTSTYRAPSFKYAGKLNYGVYLKDGVVNGEVVEIIHSRGHSAPLLKIKYENGKEGLIPGFKGAFEGKKIEINQKEKVKENEIKEGSAYLLKNLPEGTRVFNVEIKPGDSGTLIKTAGSFGIVVSQLNKFTRILLPSKKEKLVNANSRAFVGVIGGAGRLEKPILKAGLKAKEMAKKNKLYPRVSGVAMNALDHPHGGSRSLRKGKPTIAPKNAPPGRKVGMIRPKHTGRNK